jgi:hypothetical protein
VEQSNHTGVQESQNKLVNIQVIMDQIFNEAEVYFEKYLDQITISSVLEKIKQCQ